LGPEEASEISNIILSYEKYDLHRWVDREVYVKTRDKSVAQFVSEIVLSLRGYLISKKINNLSTEVSSTSSNSELLSDIKDYISLKKLIHEKLGRVFSAKIG
jgi:DNA primase